eukprot:7347705-Pyramimonas_sp.AAC.1
MAVYGRAHTWDPALSANSNLNGCRSAYPRNLPIPQNTPFLLSMAVYGRAHESYGRARRHPCMTPSDVLHPALHRLPTHYAHG